MYLRKKKKKAPKLTKFIIIDLYTSWISYFWNARGKNSCGILSLSEVFIFCFLSFSTFCFLIHFSFSNSSSVSNVLSHLSPFFFFFSTHVCHSLFYIPPLLFISFPFFSFFHFFLFTFLLSSYSLLSYSPPAVTLDFSVFFSLFLSVFLFLSSPTITFAFSFPPPLLSFPLAWFLFLFLLSPLSFSHLCFTHFYFSIFFIPSYFCFPSLEFYSKATVSLIKSQKIECWFSRQADIHL